MSKSSKQPSTERLSTEQLRDAVVATATGFAARRQSASLIGKQLTSSMRLELSRPGTLAGGFALGAWLGAGGGASRPASQRDLHEAVSDIRDNIASLEKGRAGERSSRSNGLTDHPDRISDERQSTATDNEDSASQSETSASDVTLSLATGVITRLVATLAIRAFSDARENEDTVT